MILAHILAATFVSGVVSALVAMLAGYRVTARDVSRVVFFAVGVLLAVALLELLPRGFDELGAETGGMTLLLAFVGLVLLARVIPHVHLRSALPEPVPGMPLPALPPSTQASSQISTPPFSPPSGVVPALLLGDTVHNFVDGVLIAAAFLEDPTLGWMMTLAVVLHEVPQELGDFLILIWSGLARRTALTLNLLSSMAAIVGGLCGYLLLRNMEALLPYAMVVSAASFIYLAAVEVLPRMTASAGRGETVLQGGLLVVGIGFVLAEGWLAG